MKFLPNHACYYHGNTKHIIMNAAGWRVHKAKLDKVYLNKKHKVKVYKKPDLTVDELQLMKAYSYGTEGRLYDVLGILGFIWSKIKGSDVMDYCVENVRDTYKAGGIAIIPADYPVDCTPKKFEQYVKDRGFETCYIWDKGSEGNFSLTNIPPGAIVFVEGYSWFAKLIKWWQNRAKQLSKILKI